METYRPLDCDLHDFIEIACLRGYRLRIEPVAGGEFVARALTTRTTPNKEEFLVLEGEDGQREMRLDQLLAITPCETGAEFGRVVLASRHNAPDQR